MLHYVAHHQAVAAAQAGKEVEAALHELEVAEGVAVCQALEVEVAHPEAVVTLRAVLEDGLHTFVKGAVGYALDAADDFRAVVGQGDGRLAYR